MKSTIKVSILLLHPDKCRVLLVSQGDGWSLPCFTREQWELWACVTDVNSTICQQFGIKPIALRCHDLGVTEAGDWLLYGVEIDTPSWSVPAGCRWASFDEIEREQVLPAYLRNSVMSWRVWEAQTDLRRVAWYQRGWSRSALTWITEQIRCLGLRMTGEPCQLRTCQRSTVWEVPTTEGPCFFKAVPKCFHHELAITAYLAKLFPTAIPRVLTADLSRGWMLMASAGTQQLDQSSGLDTWCAAVQRYAEMQVELSRHVERLMALGCSSFPPAQLGDNLLVMLADETALTPANDHFSLTADECRLLRDNYQQIAMLGQRLTASPIPSSLDHGDFWPAQILLRNEAPVIIDWSDASVTMPFFSLFKFLIPQEVEAAFPDHPDAEDRLRDAYLDPWTTFAPEEQLLDLYREARLLTPLHSAEFHYHMLSPHMEIRWEHANMLPYFLKRLLINLKQITAKSA